MGFGLHLQAQAATKSFASERLLASCTSFPCLSLPLLSLSLSLKIFASERLLASCTSFSRLPALFQWPGTRHYVDACVRMLFIALVYAYMTC